MQERRSTSGATTRHDSYPEKRWREPPRATHERGGEPRTPEDGLHKASGADAKLRGSGRGNSTLDTLRAITTRPAARSHHTPRSAAREVLGYQRGTSARLRTYSLLRYFPHSGYLQHWSY